MIKFWPVVFAAAMAASPTSPARVMFEVFSLALKIVVARAIAVCAPANEAFEVNTNWTKVG